VKTIASFDIETFPEMGYYFDPWKEGNIVRNVRHGYMLCWTLKYLDGKTITRALPDYKGYKPGSVDDFKLVKELHDLFEEADILIAHNGDRFDIKESNKRFIYHGLKPPAPYKTIDTLKVAKRHFKFISNKLDDLGQFLGVGAKVKHPGFDMWLGCDSGDEKSWNLMKKYNRQDVILLEAVYNKLRPWHTTHPRVSVSDTCPSCGEKEILTSRTYMTQKGQKTRGQCTCGKWREIKTHD
jgi:DNA polymerase elongation subunit (family B)